MPVVYQTRETYKNLFPILRINIFFFPFSNSSSILLHSPDEKKRSLSPFSKFFLRHYLAFPVIQTRVIPFHTGLSPRLIGPSLTWN